VLPLATALLQQRSKAIEDAQKARQRLFIIVPIAALLTLLAATALGWYVTRTVTGPLSVLTTCAEALARGDFQHQLHLRGNNELAVLGNAFNFSAGDNDEDLPRISGGHRRHDTASAAEFNGNLSSRPARACAASAATMPSPRSSSRVPLRFKNATPTG
jgi:HAMP domain-containing protein